MHFKTLPTMTVVQKLGDIMYNFTLTISALNLTEKVFFHYKLIFKASNLHRFAIVIPM